jgi:hypothetical protein
MTKDPILNKNNANKKPCVMLPKSQLGSGSDVFVLTHSGEAWENLPRCGITTLEVPKAICRSYGATGFMNIGAINMPLLRSLMHSGFQILLFNQFFGDLLESSYRDGGTPRGS